MRAPKTKEGGKVQAVPPALLLANKWTPELDPAGWFMSEKLDGVRAVWDGKDLISRLGNRFDAPAWFTAKLPKERLDGELWLGRKQFQQAISIVRSQGLDKEWAPITYRVFDMPDLKVGFEERIVAMKKLKVPEHCQVVEQVCCKDVEHLKATLKAYEDLGGEGVMLREAGSLYVGNRSSTLLKVKTFFDGVKDGVFTVGNFIITRKGSQTTKYDIPPEVKLKFARKEDVFKNKITRFQQPSPESVYLEPKRIISFDEDDD